MIKDSALYEMLSAMPALSGIPVRPDTASELDGTTYVTYQVVSLQDGAYTLTGEAGLIPWRYQIDIYSPSKATVDTLAEAICNGLLVATAANLMNAHSSFENETKSHRASLDFSIWFDNQS
jgi:hypothetical protein